MTRMDRLLRPRSIAVVGGGSWAHNVLKTVQNFGFSGDLWPVHPTRSEMAGLPVVASVDDLPTAPDATYLAINRTATVEVLRALAARDAGGAVCFASGFGEALAELSDGADLQDDLVRAAGEMCLLGPNCYGFVNALDQVAMWPDEHGLAPVTQGVAILMQSSNIALNLTMQKRGLPIGFLGTVGNQAQTDLAALGTTLLADPRITALGLHIEGIPDLRAFEQLADTARDLGKRIIALRVGASEQAAIAAVSHTASLAGSVVGAQAFLRRQGIAQVHSLDAFIEALKILHVAGPLTSAKVASMSCSGGEASLMADSALGTGVTFPPIDDIQATGLRAALGPKVALANPLDYHTYIWGDASAQVACFSAMMSREDLGIGCVVLDFPRTDRCDESAWVPVIDAVAEARAKTTRPLAILASLAETMPEDKAAEIIAAGLIPLCGVDAALQGIAAAALPNPSGPDRAVLFAEPMDRPSKTLTEAAAKAHLAAFGLAVPDHATAENPKDAARCGEGLGFPVVLKAQGLAHKTEAGGVVVGLRTTSEVQEAAEAMRANSYLVEQMVSDKVVELLVGVRRDPAHGFVLTLGAGGVWAEILQDTASCLLPVRPGEVDEMLDSLRIAPVLAGYRGAPAASRAPIHAAIAAIEAYVTAHANSVDEVEINPLVCTQDQAIAVDALIVERVAADPDPAILPR